MEAKQKKHKSFRKWLTSGWTVTGLLLLALVLFVVNGYGVTARATEDGGEGEGEPTSTLVGQTGEITIEQEENDLEYVKIGTGVPADDGVHLVTYNIYSGEELLGTLEWRAGTGSYSSAWMTVGETTKSVYVTSTWQLLNPKIGLSYWQDDPNTISEVEGLFPIRDTYRYEVIGDVKITEPIAQVDNAWWDTTRPMGILQWEAVEGAGGYDVYLYGPDGEVKAGYTIDDPLKTEIIMSDKFIEDGEYTVKIKTHGGKMTVESEWSETLVSYVYDCPDTVLSQPDKLWWTAAETLLWEHNEGLPVVANWTPVPGAKGYQVTVFAYDAETGEYETLIGDLNVYNENETLSTQANLEWQINYLNAEAEREGKSYIYKFAVQALSGDIEQWGNAEYSDPDNVSEAPELQTDIEEEIQNEISDEKWTGNWNGFFAWLLETLGKVADAMQNNMDVLAEIVEQETAYKGETSVTVEEPVVAEESGITGVEIAGAGLNATEGSLQFEIGKADENEKKQLDRKMYKGGIQLDIGLTNTVNEEEQEIKELKAPIAITMDAPEGLATERLVVLHYREDGSVERIFPKVSKDGDKDKITFAVTGFSPYVVTSIVPYELDGTTSIELDEEPGEEPGSARKPLKVEEITYTNWVMIEEGVPEDGYLHLITYKIYNKDGNPIGILEWRSGTPVFNGESMGCWMGPQEGETEPCAGVSYCRLEMNVPEGAFNMAFPGVNAAECTYEIIKDVTITEQVGEVTNIHWDESRRLVARWDPVEGADRYNVWFYYEGEMIDSWTGQEPEVSLISSYLSRSIFKSGTYSIRVQALGGKYTLCGNMSEAELVYEYERPQTVLYAPDKMWWTKPGPEDAPYINNQENMERPVIANWTRVPGANGYYIAIYACDVNAEEEEWKLCRAGMGGTDWERDALAYSANLEYFINDLDAEAEREGKEYIYKFAIQVVSADFETWANTDYSEISPMMSGEFKLQTEIEAGIKNQITAADSETILDVIKEDFSAVADAMQNNAEVLDAIKTQEATYVSQNSVTVNAPVVDEESGIIGVEIAGAGLNATAGSLQFAIGKMDATDKKRLDNKAYKGAIQLNLGLTNTVGGETTEIKELDAPVAITMDAPAGIPTELLIILHYLADGTVERIFPKVSEDGSKITFVATGFSPYVLTSVVPYDENGEPEVDLEVPVEEKLDALELTHSSNPQINLGIDFYIDLDAINTALGTSLDGSAVKLIVKKDNYDGNVKTDVWEEVLSYGGLSYYGLTPWMLGDEIRATLVVTVEGEEYARTPEVVCLKDDLMAMLSEEATRTLAVDLLNYGAEAQKYFEYRTDALVNADLTEEQQAYATALEVPAEAPAIEVTSLAEGKKIAGIAVNLKYGLATQLVIAPIAAESESLSEDIQVEFYAPAISAVFCTKMVENEDDVSGYRYAEADGLMTNLLGLDMAITVKENDTAISDTYTFSITDYLWRRYLQDGNDRGLVESLLKYAASAAGN